MTIYIFTLLLAIFLMSVPMIIFIKDEVTDNWSGAIISGFISIIMTFIIVNLTLSYLTNNGEKTLLSEEKYQIVNFNSNYELLSLSNETYLYKIEEGYIAKNLKTKNSYIYVLINEDEDYKRINIKDLKTDNIHNLSKIIGKKYRYKKFFLYYDGFEYYAE